MPRLLNLVEAKDDPASTWIIKQSEEWGIQFLRWHSAQDFQQLGIAGFDALGTNAAPAIGELTKLLDDNGHAFTAVRCLIGIGTPAEASVAEALTNKNRQVRYFATQQFAWATDDDKVFLARMRDCLKDPDASVRFAAVQGIGAQTQAPEEAVPLLMSVLEKNDSNVSSEAAGALANFGTNAMCAFNALSNVVVTGNYTPTADVALRTLVAIAPDQALPIILQNSRSPDQRRRHGALVLLCRYPVKTPEIQSAIEHAATDKDPLIARYARSFITRQYQNEHPVELQFPDEPNYRGKPLGEWLKTRDREGKFSTDAEEALRHMGTNALPALLERLVYVQPPFGLRAPQVNIEAVRAFIVMGEQALPVLPRLQTLMDSTNADTALYAMLASCGTGSNAVPILIKGLTSRFPAVRGEAAHYLTEGPGAQFSDQRKQAIPLIVKLLDDSDENVRGNATNELKEIDPEAAAKAGIK